MTSGERQAVTVALCKLALATAGQELDPARIVVYLEQLDGDPADQVLAAIARLIRTARFFPAVGDIVAEMESARGDKAEFAWITATQIARSDCDTIRRAYAADPALDFAVRSIGGIAAIGGRTLHDERYIRERFLKNYSTQRKLDLIRSSAAAARLLP